jgi:hypothetical protein
MLNVAAFPEVCLLAEVISTSHHEIIAKNMLSVLTAYRAGNWAAICMIAYAARGLETVLPATRMTGI